jgi:pimeloyl-ACP methyl ester carboxylesterase
LFARVWNRRLNAEGDVEPDRRGYVRGLSKSGFHDIAYVEWGSPTSRTPVVCVHGLTRQGRDFDYLAARLAAGGRRVVCPDLVGRGKSGRLRNPDEYALPQYCADMNVLIARLGTDQVDFVGTSLGGLIGIVLAGFPGTPIRRIVINDIGPLVPWAGLMRIGRYVADMPAAFAEIEDAERYLREVLAPFGALPDAHWRHLARHSVAWNADEQRFVMLCDPKIIRAFGNPWHYSLDLWKYWNAIEIPILVIRGIESDLLPAPLAREMERRNPRASFHEIADCGHAPALMSEDQIEVVADFLAAE